MPFFIPDLGWNLSYFGKTVEIHIKRDEKVTFDNQFEDSREWPKKHSCFRLKQCEWSLHWQVVIHWAHQFASQNPISPADEQVAIFSPRASGEQNPKKKRSTRQKVCSKFVMTSHNLSRPWRKSRLVFENKKTKIWNWIKFLKNFRPI